MASTERVEDQGRETVGRRIEDWRRRLIDLSYRNRLIKFRPTQASTLIIESPSISDLLADPSRSEPWGFFLPPEREDSDLDTSEAAEAVDRAVLQLVGPEEVPREDEIVVGERNPKRIARILDTLAKRSNSELQDKGLRTLYLAAGFLEWIDPKTEEAISSPLVLVPVELRRESTGHPYKLYFVDDEDIVINPSLTEKLRYDAGLEIPGDWSWEDKPIDVELGEIRDAVKETAWTVRGGAVLSLFSFQKYVMYRDLLDNEDAVAVHPLVQAFAGVREAAVDRMEEIELPDREELDEVQSPETTLSILDADASQRLCVEAAKRGQSFVMHGPPGTGKSQTIANIISEAIGVGKRVLFVSEKAAALDVVNKRLVEAGVDEYCLLLHGEHASRRAVVEELYRCMIEHQLPRDAMNQSEFTRLSNVRTVLTESVRLLHLPMDELGERSLRDVLGELSQLHDVERVSGVPKPSKLAGVGVRHEFHALQELFQRLAERWDVSGRDFPWRGFALPQFTVEERGRVTETLAGASQAMASLEFAGGDLARAMDWPVPLNRRSVEGLIRLHRHLSAAPYVMPEHWLLDGGVALATAIDAAQPAYEELAQRRRRLDDSYSGRDLDSFSKDADRELTTAIRGLADDLGRTDRWEVELLSRLARYDEFVSGSGELLSDLARVADRLAEGLGQPTERLTLRRIRELADLAGEVFAAENRPEREWLSSAGMDRVVQTLENDRALFERFQTGRDELLQEYQPEALELDARAMHARFTNDYTGAFTKLRRSYREDARAIKAVKSDGKLPPEPAVDLQRIQALRELRVQIEGESDRYRRALGRFFDGVETDPQRIEDAVGVAREVRALMAPGSNMERLADCVCADSGSLASVAELADEARHHADAVASGLEDLRALADRDSGLREDDSLSEIRERLVGLAPRIHQVNEVVEPLARSSRGQVAALAALEERAELVAGLHRIQQFVAESESGWHDAMDQSFRGATTDWESLRRATTWLSRLTEMAGLELPRRIVATVASGGTWPDRTAAEQASVDYDARFEDLVELFEESRRTEVEADVADWKFNELAEWIDELGSRLDDLGDYVEYCHWVDRAGEKGWLRFVRALVKAEIEAEQVVSTFSFAYWNRRLEVLFSEDEDLRDGLRAEALERWIGEFRRLDRKLVSTGADRLISYRNDQRTDFVLAPGSQGWLIRAEHGKKRRHRPVRRLLADIPEMLGQLKPCLMMTPLGASHFLTAEHRFDLVVFDEASQVPPQDAINCIYRGDQLIVAGDSEQLPPTPFFKIAEAEDTGFDEESEGAEEDMESILDSAKALLPEHRLRWHYRSRDEHLIDFSNRHIYNGGLVTFPAPDQHSVHKGVDFMHVAGGIYDRGKSSVNRVEAAAVAQRVLHHLNLGLEVAERGGEPRSIGVIAFNTQQADAISEELDRLLLDHPEAEALTGGDRLENTFIKHLEAVQGDERDVIIFSVGFGFDPEGRFTMNFGPLNKAGGRRRLNVAVTRARENVEVVASVTPADFKLTEGSSDGAKLLRDYIAYAREAGPYREHIDDGRMKSAIEREIAAAVRELGYFVVPEVGAGSIRIPLGVKATQDSEDYLLGIETDGVGYVQIPTARDRDRLRYEVLADRLGWSLHRIWSTEWTRNRGAEIERLEGALKKASRSASRPSAAPVQETKSESKSPRERVSREPLELSGSETATAPPWVIPYETADLRARRTNYEFHESASQAELKDLLIELVSVEGPIGKDHAIRRLAQSWGLGRVGHRIRAAGKRIVKAAERSGAVEVRGDFLWPVGGRLDRVRVPVPGEPHSRRSIEDIPPEEIDLAAARLRDSSPGIDGDSLILQVARVLGFDRTGERIRSVLEARILQPESG